MHVFNYKWSRADTQKWNNVDSTLLQRLDIESTLFKRRVPAGDLPVGTQHWNNVVTMLIQSWRRNNVEPTLFKRCVLPGYLEMRWMLLQTVQTFYITTYC